MRREISAIRYQRSGSGGEESGEKTYTESTKDTEKREPREKREEGMRRPIVRAHPSQKSRRMGHPQVPGWSASARKKLGRYQEQRIRGSRGRSGAWGID